MSVVWNTGTAETTTPGAVVALAATAQMAPGDFVDSPSGTYRLQFQADGNLVLTHLPSTVLWSSNSDGAGGDSARMQGDGNLVVYAGATPLWASGTAGTAGAYLVLQNDGNLIIYTSGGIEQIGVLTSRPNWQGNGITETLSWLTSVSESPQAVEQRMGLRLSPRQMIEITFTLFGAERTYFDLLVMRMSGSPFYMPVWHDTGRTAALATPGMTTIAVDTTLSELADCRLAVLLGDNPFEYEIVEIFERSASALTLVAGLAQTWPAGSRIHPAKKVRVETQPSGQRYADRAYQATARFTSLEPNPSSAVATLGQFKGNYVLEEDPNDVEALAHNYERKMFALDQQVGLQVLSDVAGFVNQSYAWFGKGRAGQWRLRGLFYALQGRRVPIWIPTYFADFDLASPIGASDTTLIVKRCGYTEAGGPFKNREYILIQLTDGTRFYRQIGAASLNGPGTLELLAIDTALGQYIPIAAVQRISFLSFCRLDQDQVEFVHHTDTRGVTTVNSVFRTDPGIAGVNSEDETEIAPGTPASGPPYVFDPFRSPNGKVWTYNPGFATNAGSPYVGIWWSSRRSTAELINDNPGLPTDIGDAFPPSSISGSGSNIALPLTGSFLVRVGLYWNNMGWDSPTTIYFRMQFPGSLIPDIEMVALHEPGGQPIDLSRQFFFATKRTGIAANLVSPTVPLQVHLDYKFVGGVNAKPICNPAGDCEPFHGDASAVGGDAYYIVEWWS